MVRTETNNGNTSTGPSGRSTGPINGGAAAPGPITGGAAAAPSGPADTDNDNDEPTAPAGPTGQLGGLIFDDPAAATAPGPGPGPSSGSGNEQQPRRGPGGWNRGKKRVNGQWVNIDSTGPSSSAAGGPGTGPRTSAPGPRTAPAAAGGKAKVSASLEGIEGILLSIHMMLATFTQIKELELSQDEAQKLSAAIARVAALYDVGASEKTLAWMNLAMCAGGIYGTRAWAYKLRTDTEAESKRPKLVTPVYSMGGPQQQPQGAAL